MKIFYYSLLTAALISGCANSYPENYIPSKTTHVAEEKPEKYPHPPEDLRSTVGNDGSYYRGGYYYPSRNYYNRYYWYYN